MIDWRAIREVFGVMRRGGILVLLSDWGWKPDGIPCQLFGRWTTLPSGPAVIAARGNAPIIPFFVRRERPGAFYILYGAPISAGNGSPAAQLAAVPLPYEGLACAPQGVGREPRRSLSGAGEALRHALFCCFYNGSSEFAKPSSRRH